MGKNNKEIYKACLFYLKMFIKKNLKEVLLLNASNILDNLF